MTLLAKLRCITVDVTGTLLAYKGELGDYYCMAAKSVGLPCPDYVCRRALNLHTPIWQRSIHVLVIRTKCPILFGGRERLLYQGYDYHEDTVEKVFKRIYAMFGSSAPYTIFPDSQPFLRWARKNGLKVGIVSNIEYRYQDVILPALGLNQGTEWDFGVFSGLEGVEKANPKIYEIALEKAGNVVPEEALHIGDSMRKDYLWATSVGMHGLLLDRFKTSDAINWRKSGAPVLDDLVAAQEWLTSDNRTC